MPDIKSDIEALLQTHEARITRALLRAIQDIKDQAVLADIERALRRNDIEGAIDAMRIERAAFEALQDEIAAAVRAGGDDVAGAVAGLVSPQGMRLAFRFSVRNARAERFLAELSSTLITQIVEEQRANVRLALTAGMERGDNPNRVALDIVGRINRDTQRREGGIVGLSGPFEEYVRNARTELETGNYQSYFSRTRRDKRFDRIIARAKREGKPLTADQVSKITGRYADRLLALRGETIGRTEAMSSLMFGKNEAMRQLVDSGKVRADQVKKVWQATLDKRVRDTHAALHKQTAILNEPFKSPSGARLMYPMDRSLGARGAEIINCRCNLKFRIDWLSNYMAEDLTP